MRQSLKGLRARPCGCVTYSSWRSESEQPSVQRVSPAQSVHLLRNNTYRYQYISDLKLTRNHFHDCVRLAEGTKVWRLTRPRRHSALAECQELIEQSIR